MNRKIWLYLGIGTEVFHVLFLIGVFFLGRLWLPDGLVNFAVTITVMGQVIFLWCPLSVLSGYFFRKYDPERKPAPSLTFYLYRKFGRAVGIPIFIILILVSTLIGMARFK